MTLLANMMAVLRKETRDRWLLSFQSPSFGLAEQDCHCLKLYTDIGSDINPLPREILPSDSIGRLCFDQEATRNGFAIQ